MEPCISHVGDRELNENLHGHAASTLLCRSVPRCLLKCPQHKCPQVYCTPRPLSFSQEIENNQMYKNLNITFHCLQVEFKVSQGTKKFKINLIQRVPLYKNGLNRFILTFWCEDKIVSFFRDLTFR